MFEPISDLSSSLLGRVVSNRFGTIRRPPGVDIFCGAVFTKVREPKGASYRNVLAETRLSHCPQAR
ncbi:MAG: hypothetical protein ACE5IY_16355 [bacterium]